MTNKQILLKYLAENGQKSNKEISTELKMSEGYVKKEISQLKSSGYLFIENENGVRTIHVVRGIPAGRSDYKKDIYQELLDGYMEDFRAAENRIDRKEVGSLILRIVERL